MSDAGGQGDSPEEIVIDLNRKPTESSGPVRNPAITRLAAALAVIVAVPAVVLGVQYLGRDRAKPSALPTATPTPVATVDTRPVEPAVDLPPLILMQASFWDADHGYAVMLRCTTKRFEECTTDLSVTTDGGSVWARLPLPEAVSKGAFYAGARLYVLAERTLVMDQPEAVIDTGSGPGAMPSAEPGTPGFDPTQVPGYQAPMRWLSRDGGQSWREVSTKPSGTVTEIPAGGQVVFVAPGPFAVHTPGSGDGVVIPEAIVLRRDGTSARLRQGPGKDLWVDSSTMAATDGSVWVTGWSMAETMATPTGGDVQRRVQVSHDRGRTWHVVMTPAGPSAIELYTVDGRSLYLVSYSESREPTVSHSSDAGRTWRDVANPGEPRPMPSGPDPDHPFTLSVAPLKHGGLIMAKSGKLYTHWPGTRAFTEAVGAPSVEFVQPAGACVLAMASGPAHLMLFYSSTDGANWRLLQLN